MNRKIILLFAFFAVSILVKAQIKAYEYSSQSFNETTIQAILENSRKNGTPEWEVEKLKKHLFERLEKQKQRLALGNSERIINTNSLMATCQAGCANLGFESGSTTGWNLKSADINSVNLPCNTCPAGTSAITALTTSSNSGAMWTNGVDNCSGQPALAPGGGVYSLALNNMTSGGKMQEIDQTYSVSPTNNVLTYQYLAVLENPGHPVNQQPYFFSQVLDGSGNPIACTYYLQAADAAATGWTACSATGGCSDALYKGWVTVTLDLTSYIGQCVTVQFIASDCNQGGHYGYAYIDASCDQINVNNVVTICPGTTVLAGPPGFTTYTWTGPVNGTGQNLSTSTPGSYTLVTTAACPAPTRFYTVNVSPTPTVNFSSTVTPCNYTVPFTDLSTIGGGATITTWSWTFGDNGTSTLQNPSHTYATTGTFNVALTCTTSAGCVGTYSSTVTIGTGPNAAFSASTVCPGNPTVFTNTSVGATSYSWNFGDGVGTSTLSNPTYTYPGGSGTYTAVLTASGTGACVSTKSVTVSVSALPTATISAPPVCLGNATVFTSTITSASTYSWTFGDGQTSTGSATPSHTYGTASTFPVSLTVTAVGGCTVVATTNVIVNPVPTASFTVSTVCQGTASHFDATASTPVGATYSWNFGGAAPNTDVLTGVQTDNHTYPASGTFPVTLLVTVGTCSANATGSAIVNPMPVLGFTTNHACDQSPITITNTTAAQGTFTNWHWDMGDGVGTSAVAAPAPYTYPAPGIYTVVLTATTSTGCTGTVTVRDTVHANPVAGLLVYEACLGNLAYFYDQSTLTNPAGLTDVISGWNWSYGDGGSGATPDSANHMYAACGPYVVSLTVTTNYACKNNTSVNDTIFCLPQIVAPASFNICPGTLVTSAQTTFTTTCAAPVLGTPTGILFVNNPNPRTNQTSTHGGIPLADTSDINSIPNYPAIAQNLTCKLLTDTIYGYAVTVYNNQLACIGNVATFTINVYPTPTVSPVNNILVCANQSVNVPNFSGCPSPETYSWTTGGSNVGITGPTGSGNIGSFTGQNTGSTSLTEGVTVTPWANGCSGPSMTFSVTVNPIPTMTVSSPAYYCPGSLISSTDYNINTTPSPGPTYSWTATNLAGTGMAASGTGGAPQTAYNAPANGTGVNQLSVVTYTPSYNGCVGLPVKDTITIKPTPQMVAMPDQFWCPNQNTTQVNFAMNPVPSATAVVAYNWSYNVPSQPLPSTGSSPPSPPFFPSLPTSNAGLTTLITAVSVTPTLNGCVGPPGGFNIFVYPSPIPLFKYFGPVCDGKPMAFTDLSKPNTGSITVNQWSWSNNGAPFSASQNPASVIAPVGTNMISLTVFTSSAPSCTATITEPVYVSPNPVADFVGDTLKRCPILHTNFTDQSSVTINGVPTTSITAWNWTFGNGNSSTSQTPAQQTYTNSSPTQSAYYNVSLTVTTDSGCTNAITKNKYIEAYPRPIAGFGWGPVGADIDDPSITFVNSAQGASGYPASHPTVYGPEGVQYYLGDVFAFNPNSNNVYGSNIIGSTFNHVYEHYDAYTYYVTQWVINSFGCKDSITEPVEILPNFTFYIPNAFSPNGDGTNEGFKGLGIGIDNSTYNLWVFDRWGLMIFYADDIDKSWDGHIRGNEGQPIVQEDVYVWKVKFNDTIHHKLHEYHGTVTLLK